MLQKNSLGSEDNSNITPDNIKIAAVRARVRVRVRVYRTIMTKLSENILNKSVHDHSLYLLPITVILSATRMRK